MENLPCVDLRDFIEGVPQARQAFAHRLGEAFTEVGFVIVENHTLSPALQAAVYQQVEAFFSLPEKIKSAYIVPGVAGQRGYTPKNQETAKGYTTPDLKEFFHIGPEKDPTDPPELLPNIWPRELPEFEEVLKAAYREFFHTGRLLLQAVALYLDLPVDYFEERIRGGPSLLRLLHYYGIEDSSSLPPDATRAAAHGDINVITLLIGASAEGLEVLTRQNTWLSPTVQPHQMVVNVGDMLEYFTAGRLRSTIHRVVLPPPEKRHLPRYSVPFFLHFRPEVEITPLPQFTTPETAVAYPPLTAGDFLDQRLRELGLKK
ncbi:MAG: isopenicillin N synthase family dioxygenase [Bacteroidia bacterium]